MKGKLIFTLLIATAHISFSQVSIDSIKAIIKQEVASKRSKSIIVGIVDANGRQIFAEGKLSDNNPVLPDGNTIYEIGSITKVFTSVLLADMHLKRQVNLNDPISKYLPKTVKSPVRNGKEISLLTLSTHRSGMPRFPYNVDPKNLDNPFVDYTLNQMYQYISDFEPDYDIDTRWRYSNTAYGLLGHILASVARKNYETLVKQTICQPLKMNRTVITLTPALRSNIAIGHTEYGKPTVFTDLPALEGAGALRSTVNDLLTFAAANLEISKTDLQPAFELTHILQAKKDGDDTYTTMGWTLSNDNDKYHLFKDGGTAGYRTFLGIDKKNKIGIVVLSNSNNSVTDIGWHLLDFTRKILPFKYQWNLLDTLRSTIQTKGVEASIQLFYQLKTSKDPSFIFNIAQLNYLGNELRRDKKINEAIQIYELNAKEYPKSATVYDSLGETYKRNKNKKKAIESFEKASELEPQNNIRWNYVLEKLKND